MKAFGHSTQMHHLYPFAVSHCKEVIKGETEPLNLLPHCHDVDGVTKVCVHVCVNVCVHVCVNV